MIIQDVLLIVILQIVPVNYYLLLKFNYKGYLNYN